MLNQYFIKNANLTLLI